MNLLLEANPFPYAELVIIIVFASIFGLATLFATIVRTILVHRYWAVNRHKTEHGLTGEQTAKMLLEVAGLTDVKVKKCNFFEAIFYGNSYSCRKKLIRLRGHIFNRTTTMAVGIASQKVALAEQDRLGNKKLKVRSALWPWVTFAPLAFVPIVLIGLLLDLLIAKGTFVMTIIGLIVGFIYYVGAFIATLLTIGVEKEANKASIELIKQSGLLSDEETNALQKVYNLFVLAYIADFILAILNLIKYIYQVLKILIKLKR